ncbi:MAG: hypothetical protein ACUVQ5_02220 [Candidatus Methanomethylicaceae archaeon]
MIMENAKDILTKYVLCDSCLGRQFGGLVRGVTNKERGRAIKLVLALEGHARKMRGEGGGLLEILADHGMFQPAANILDLKSDGGSCYICEGIMEKIGEYAREVVRVLE